MNLTDNGEGLVLDWLLAIGTPDRPTSLYIALHTGDPAASGEDDENFGADEVSAGLDADYERKLITFSGTDNVRANDVSASWTVAASSDGYTVTHASLWTAATGGDSLMHGELGVPKPLDANGVLTFNIGDINVVAD